MVRKYSSVRPSDGVCFVREDIFLHDVLQCSIHAIYENDVLVDLHTVSFTLSFGACTLSFEISSFISRSYLIARGSLSLDDAVDSNLIF